MRSRLAMLVLLGLLAGCGRLLYEPGLAEGDGGALDAARPAPDASADAATLDAGEDAGEDAGPIADASFDAGPADEDAGPPLPLPVCGTPTDVFAISAPIAGAMLSDRVDVTFTPGTAGFVQVQLFDEYDGVMTGAVIVPTTSGTASVPLIRDCPYCVAEVLDTATPSTCSRTTGWFSAYQTR